MARASHGSLVDAIGMRVVDGDLPAGHVLTLAALEEEYGVSRTVVREAVRVLEAMGMLEQRRRVGITVRAAAHWSALDTRLIGWQLAGRRRDQLIVNTTELRAAIEPVAARLSARRATDLQRGEILRLAEELDRLGAAGLGNSPEYLAADIAFHDLILLSRVPRSRRRWGRAPPRSTTTWRRPPRSPGPTPTPPRSTRDATSRPCSAKSA